MKLAFSKISKDSVCLRTEPEKRSVSQNRGPEKNFHSEKWDPETNCNLKTQTGKQS